MVKNDNDLIDEAIRGAEAQLAGEAEETAAPEPIETPESQESVEVPAEEPEAKPSTAPNRDKTGKFTKPGKTPKISKGQSAQAVDSEGEAVTAELVDAQPAAEAVEATEEIPSLWPEKLRELSAEASPALIRAFKEHDAQREQWARSNAQQGRQAHEAMGRIKEVFEPHRAKFQVNGVRDEVEAVSRLLAWNEIFESDPLTGIRDLMSKNGITVYDLEGHAQQYPSDPRLEEALRAAEEAKAQAAQLQQRYDEGTRAQGRMALETFRQGKDPRGQVRAQAFDIYRPQITDAFTAIQHEAPHLSESEILNHAYEFVMGEVRKLHGIAPQTQAPKPVPAAQARAASKIVSGAPAEGVARGAQKLSGKTFEEKLNAAAEMALEMHT